MCFNYEMFWTSRITLYQNAAYFLSEFQSRNASGLALDEFVSLSPWISTLAQQHLVPLLSFCTRDVKRSAVELCTRSFSSSFSSSSSTSFASYSRLRWFHETHMTPSSGIQLDRHDWRESSFLFCFNLSRRVP